MNKNIFRKSSIDRVSSPEQLNEYIRVANPSVWIILAAVMVLLAGVIVWGVFGRVETKVETCVSVNGSVAVCYVTADDAARLKEGMTVTAENVGGKITKIPDAPMQIGEGISDYILYLTGFSKGSFCYAVEVELNGLADGVYRAVITVDSVAPISFVTH